MQAGIFKYLQPKSAQKSQSKEIADPDSQPAPSTSGSDGKESDGEIKTFNRKRKRRDSDVPETPVTLIHTIKPGTTVTDPKQPGSTVQQRSGKNKPKQSTQLHLDIGQKDFHATRCQECGLVYTPGDPEDEKLHRLQHTNTTKGIKYSPQTNDKVVVQDGTKGKIIALSSNKRQLDKLSEFLEGQLGAVPGWLLADPSASVFIYVATDVQRITGCIVLQKIKYAHPVITHNEDIETKDNKCGELRTLTTDTSSRVAVHWGVRLMWVSVECRRLGIATKLLDSVRSYLVLGYVIPKTKLAFTQPTEQGTMFIRKYTGVDNFLVYDGE